MMIFYIMFFFFFFKQKTAYEMLRSLVGSEMCIRDRYQRRVRGPIALCHEVQEPLPAGSSAWGNVVPGAAPAAPHDSACCVRHVRRLRCREHPALSECEGGVGDPRSLRGPSGARDLRHASECVEYDRWNGARECGGGHAMCDLNPVQV
eukprot:TRINITY_DN5937_c0_g1_i1.p2 TRINITY_DN5937_c0_g1~~TRINITY_DN5937_c0_g1_i1.p2  ORF type:complete len:149 (-),score=32.19 TRINITY_DN5937_c0_g1_i1:707-1153(-)